MSCFKPGIFPTKYLGAPLFPGRARIHYFTGLEESIRSRTHSWSKNLLSFGGRITLIQSILSSLPLHILSALPVPKACILRIQRMIKDFLWDHGDSSRKHWVKWSHICLPKAEGGLGIRSLFDIKAGCLGRLAWNFLCGKSLWAVYVCQRYRSNPKGSGLWNMIFPWISKLRRNSFWDLGKGNTTIGHFGFWLELDIPINLRDLSIKEVVSDGALLSSLLDFVPPVAHGLFGYMQFSDAEDVLLWRRSESGAFTNKTFYDTF